MKRNEVVKPEAKGKLFVTPLEEVLPMSMLPYAEFVILDRALPRVEDGLKPVQRRILYTMYEMGLMPDKPHKKSARIVGDCMGKYHPHGDSSVYDAMVRMAQNFNMGMTLVNGHGNFGSVDGDPAAAMRYTEARLEPLALELLRDLEKGTVPFSLNFDDSLKEPDMLPGRFPNLLVNGASGIAVGLATNIPPHNLGETIDAVVAYIDNPNLKLDALMKCIPGPDFPTGGFIIAESLKEAYASGRGRILLRARITVEEGDNDSKKNIVISELPYQVNKSQLLRRIADLREEKKEEFGAITKVADESDRVGMRAVIEVKSDCDIPKLMKALYKYSDLETSFSINIVAIAGGKPQTMGLYEIIKYYVNYQREVVLKRTKYDLNEAKERCHILEGLIIAVRNIDEVIAIIKGAESTADAREKLKARFELDDKQAQAILDLRLARLTKLEIYKLEEELKALKALIEELSAIVASKELQLGVVKKEILEIKKKYRSPRRSTIVGKAEEAEAERTDIREAGVPCKLALTAEGKIKCIGNKTFAGLNKTIGEQSKKSAILLKMIDAVSDEPVLAFTNLGNAYRLYPADCMCKFTDGGYKLSDFYETERGEKPVCFLPVKGEKDLLFITKKGMLKRSPRSEYKAGKPQFQAVKLNERDELYGVEEWNDSEDATVFFVTKGGMCLNAKKGDVPVQGRVSAGVKGMNLKEKDEVIFATQTEGEGEIVVALSGGRFKRVITAQIDPISRNCKGVQIASLKGDDCVIFADCVTVPYPLAVETEEGELTELNTEDVPIDATNTRGRLLKNATWVARNVYALHYRAEE